LPGTGVRNGAHSFLGRDPRMLEVLELVDEVAPTEAPVLIAGESGTGKDLIARRLHARSARCRGPYVALNCAAVAETLQESEMFGHLPGAFTGAISRQRGRFESADGGTLFLDEVGEMSPSLQVKLLRVLQSGEYTPVGSSEERRCDVRVIAATNQELGMRIRTGTFRPDLYYRLSVIRIEVPPLRERPEDILLLARSFAAAFAAAYGKPEPTFAPDLERTLLRYSFPGNVRELENVLHRAVILWRSGPLATGLLPPELLAAGRLGDEPSGAANFHEAKQVAIEQFEREYLVAVLRDCGGIVSRAASRSGLSERNFHEKLNKYGIDGLSFRAASRAPGSPRES